MYYDRASCEWGTLVVLNQLPLSNAVCFDPILFLPASNVIQLMTLFWVERAFD